MFMGIYIVTIGVPIPKSVIEETQSQSSPTSMEQVWLQLILAQGVIGYVLCDMLYDKHR